MMVPAINLTKSADYFLVLGTSMQVYPAASLIDYVPTASPKFLIDPVVPDVHLGNQIQVIQDKATTGMEKFTELLLNSLAH
jgi:NAD-dependent deacetylase